MSVESRENYWITIERYKEDVAVLEAMLTHARNALELPSLSRLWQATSSEQWQRYHSIRDLSGCYNEKMDLDFLDETREVLGALDQRLLLQEIH